MREVRHLLVTPKSSSWCCSPSSRSATSAPPGTTSPGRHLPATSGGPWQGRRCWDSFSPRCCWGRAASSGGRGRGLSQQQEQELGALRTENERLRGQHAQAVSERDQYRAALASAMPANQGLERAGRNDGPGEPKDRAGLRHNTAGWR